jgi:RNA polymerase sigma-70 factor (ECF subfamily)
MPPAADAIFGPDNDPHRDFCFNAQPPSPVQRDDKATGNESSAAMAWTGDRDSFDRLMREHLPAAQRFAMRLTCDPHESEEVVQDALLRVARSWQSFRGESSFQTWLLRIVIHAAHDRRTRPPMATTAALDDEPVDVRPIDPAELASAADLGERIARLVSGLPERQRDVLVLTAYERLTTAEAAAVLGTSEQNVRTNLHLARTRLKAQLANVLDVNRGTDRPSPTRKL